MAAIELIMEVEDRSGDKASTSVKLEATATIAQMGVFAVAWATAVNLFILGKIISVVGYLLPSIGTLTSNTIVETSDVEHIGKFQFITANGRRVNVNIPALDEAAVNAYSSDALDQAEPEVAAFIAAMLSGIAVTGGTISPTDIGEDNITDVIFAREAFRNSGVHR